MQSSLSVLLVNPPIFDFTAYDFWLRPYGMLRVAGRIAHACRLSYFDYLTTERRDSWGRGRFPSQRVEKPPQFRDIPRYFRRFGRPRRDFRDFLKRGRYDVALIQSSMTYWYPGLLEVIQDLRELQPGAKIVVGGTYATLCPRHARSLGADLVVEAAELEPLWRLLSIAPVEAAPFWEFPLRDVGVLKLTDGCPFRCTYCSVPVVSPDFSGRPTAQCWQELSLLAGFGARHIAFYDDALLFRPGQVLIPFLKRVLAAEPAVDFHTPNALNARFITDSLARLMVRAGFRSFFLGLESAASGWQTATGGKISSGEYTASVQSLKAAGANSITTYIIVGHPSSDTQGVESSMHVVHESGSRILLSEFSPIPGTPDGEACRRWADLSEPLTHNKTAFTIRRLGPEAVNRLKQLSRSLNERLPSCRTH